MSTPSEEEATSMMIGGLRVETEAMPARKTSPKPPEVVVTAIAIPFGSLVVFSMKLMLASIPAWLLLALAAELVGTLLR